MTDLTHRTLIQVDHLSTGVVVVFDDGRELYYSTEVLLEAADKAVRGEDIRELAELTD